VNPDTVRAALSVQPDQVPDAARADADMRRLYGSGDFEHVNYELTELPDGRRVFAVDVAERAWGPHYVRLGLGLASDFSGNATYNLLVTTRSTWLNGLGAEWRNDLQTGQTDRLRTEWHQPLNARQSVFAAAYAQLLREPFDIYSSEQRIGRYRRSSETAGLDAGVAVGQAVELRVGVSRGTVRLNTDTGIVSGGVLVPTTETAGVTARLRVDTLDSIRFPRHGYALDASLFRSQPALGATDSYGKALVSLLGAASLDAHSLRAAFFETRSAGSGSMPDYELSSLGGFLRLSGYPTGRFLATESRLGRLVYTWRVATPGLLDGAYLGVSAEWGRITDPLGTFTGVPLRGNAIFLAMDTPLGPVYLGRGRSGQGDHATYFYLGLP
jgi:NTE family protein